MIRVLVVDDSPTARALLVHVLDAAPGIRVVGQASDGDEALGLVQALHPDLVTMDIEMPRMDGLSATRAIMHEAPTPIVVVTGHARAREVEATLATLRTGALDVIEKLPAPDSTGFASASRRLVATVRAMAEVKVIRHWLSLPDPPPAMPYAVASTVAAAAPRGARGRVVAIAASTGGPAALQRLLSGLPDRFDAPILVVQHITRGFTAGLASWLDGLCSLRVKVAEQGEPLRPRTVYIAPDDRHLGVLGTDLIALNDLPPVAGFRPSGTHLFESVASAFGASAIALILTGMGDDGVLGLHAIRRRGGCILAQDEPSSVIFGMPRAAVEAGLADAVLPLDAIAGRLAALA